MEKIILLGKKVDIPQLSSDVVDMLRRDIKKKIVLISNKEENSKGFLKRLFGKKPDSVTPEERVKEISRILDNYDRIINEIQKNKSDIIDFLNKVRKMITKTVDSKLNKSKTIANNLSKLIQQLLRDKISEENINTIFYNGKECQIVLYKNKTSDIVIKYGDMRIKCLKIGDLTAQEEFIQDFNFSDDLIQVNLNTLTQLRASLEILAKSVILLMKKLDIFKKAIEKISENSITQKEMMREARGSVEQTLKTYKLQSEVHELSKEISEISDFALNIDELMKNSLLPIDNMLAIISKVDNDIASASKEVEELTKLLESGTDTFNAILNDEEDRMFNMIMNGISNRKLLNEAIDDADNVSEEECGLDFEIQSGSTDINSIINSIKTYTEERVKKSEIRSNNRNTVKNNTKKKVSKLEVFKKLSEELDTNMKKIPNLTVLDLKHIELTQSEIRLIARSIKNLTTLFIGKNKVGTQTLSYIAEKLPKLRNLEICDNKLVNKAISQISKLKMLSYLRLHNCSLGNTSCIELSTNLRRLKELYLSNNKIGSEGVKALTRKLNRLEILDLSNNHIGVVGVKAIIRYLPYLKKLSLKGNKIDNDSALEIATNMKNLRKLDLSETDVESHLINHFSMMLPKCIIYI